MGTIITDSQFYMWRTIFAVAHADGVVTTEEKQFMEEALADMPFTQIQSDMLRADITTPQSVEAMYNKIEHSKDQAAFFSFASRMAHIDGDYGAEEQEIILRLSRKHMLDVDVGELVGHVDLQFQSDTTPSDYKPPEKLYFRDALASYRDAFLKRISAI